MQSGAEYRPSGAGIQLFAVIADDFFDLIDVPLVTALHVKTNGTGSKRGK
jgi:hypothetical protein